MALRVNVLQYKGFVSAIAYLVRKNWASTPSTSGSYGRQAGRLAGRRNTAGFRNLENPLQVKLFGFLLCLYSSAINSVRSAL